MKRGKLVAAMLIGSEFLCWSSKAQEGPTKQDTAEQSRTGVDKRDQIIEELVKRVAALEKEVQELRSKDANGGSVVVSTPARVTTAAEVTTGAKQSPAQQTRTAPSEEYDKEELVAREALDRALIARGGLLLPRGTIEFDNGISYFNSSADRLSVNGFTVAPILVVGDIVSQRAQRDIVLSSVTTRLGLPDDFQLDVRVPYGYQSERTVTADNNKTSQRYLGLGDVEVGLTKQLRRGRGFGPDVLAGFRWKSTTGPDPYQPTSTEVALGTGFQGLQGSVTMVKPSDPLVYFGSFSYTANLSTTKQFQTSDPTSSNGLTRGFVDPGDTIGFQVGTALSVNPEASLSFALDQRFTRSTSLNGQSLPGTYLSAAVFQVGTTYVYAPGRSIDLGLGIGLSRGAPDFQFSVNFPLRFSLNKRAR